MPVPFCVKKMALALVDPAANKNPTIKMTFRIVPLPFFFESVHTGNLSLGTAVTCALTLRVRPHDYMAMMGPRTMV